MPYSNDRFEAEQEPEAEIFLTYKTPEDALTVVHDINLQMDLSFFDNPDEIPEELQIAKINPDNPCQVRIGSTETSLIQMSHMLTLLEHMKKNRLLKEQEKFPQFERCSAGPQGTVFNEFNATP